ncbi:hypothetical protein L2E82_42376 [Cichorium intybus]|uniref:Uncharacterized protein n=1 Tax=Cichorium intybus TaxID=13427 RepID=A0ACB8ZL01_CICIN|nr:hypothetical protein L2E82_42376 [Cichorium intybus]
MMKLTMVQYQEAIASSIIGGLGKRRQQPIATDVTSIEEKHLQFQHNKSLLLLGHKGTRIVRLASSRADLVIRKLFELEQLIRTISAPEILFQEEDDVLVLDIQSHVYE